LQLEEAQDEIKRRIKRTVRKEREEEEAKGEREEEEKRAYYTHNSDAIRTHTTTENIPWGLGRRQLSDQSAILTLPHLQ
jgi:hypothetical protein